MAVFRLINDEIADLFEQVAALLRTQEANAFRVKAWAEGATTIRSLDRPLAEILDTEERKGLERLPGIGVSLASAIEELLHTGRLRLLERLSGEVSPEDLFTIVPGIGEGLAHRIHAELGIETLEELELAAHDGRLECVGGFGPRRTRLVRDELGAMLTRSSHRRARLIRRHETARATPPRPSVSLLLQVDERYRTLAAHGKLRKIAPRRFNPEGNAWLPILHVDVEGWSFTALFSNSARAHELGHTRDWVVVYFVRGGDEGQCTVVTEYRGPLAGRRVVRGREVKCAKWYTQGEGNGSDGDPIGPGCPTPDRVAETVVSSRFSANS